MAVPKTIHRIWLDDPMPKPFEEFGNDWKRLHPGWSVVDWRDSSELPSLINPDVFDNAKDIFPKDWKRFQADVLRLELLYMFGGVYADTDVQPLKNFGPWLSRPATLGLSPNTYHGRSIVTQAIMISEPGNGFILDCIMGIPYAVKNYAGRPLAQVVGPHHIQRTLDTSAHAASVHVVPSHVFYPVSISDRDARKRVNLGSAYATHGWNTTAKKRGKGVK